MKANHNECRVRKIAWQRRSRHCMNGSEHQNNVAEYKLNISSLAENRIGADGLLSCRFTRLPINLLWLPIYSLPDALHIMIHAMGDS
jgi:hypothetical protein